MATLVSENLITPKVARGLENSYLPCNRLRKVAQARRPVNPYIRAGVA